MIVVAAIVFCWWAIGATGFVWERRQHRDVTIDEVPMAFAWGWFGPLGWPLLRLILRGRTRRIVWRKRN